MSAVAGTPPAAPAGAPAMARILVVDDDPGVLRAVTRILEGSYDVCSVSAPAKARDASRAFRPEIAILDVRMPDMDGFDLMHELREDAPDLDFIMMTGSVAEPDVHLVRAIEEGAYYFIEKPFDRRVMLTLVSRCLERRRLRREERRYLQRLEASLGAARQFQRSLLPPREASLCGVSVSARYVACSELGGDLYDYAPAGNGAVALLLADVSGHGPTAAMLTGVVKSAFRAAAADAYDPLAVVERVAAGLSAFEARRFVTLFCGRIDGAGAGGAATLTYVNAGHPPALVARGDRVSALDSTGPLVSSGFCELPWTREVRTLDVGERLLVYSDGVTDVRGPRGFFGRGRLEEIMRNTGAARGALLDVMLEALRDHAGAAAWDDDVTLMTVGVS
jgi:sigma-B regulation protein RsbU (phosphoserine phosphatase)